MLRKLCFISNFRIENLVGRCSWEAEIAEVASLVSALQTKLAACVTNVAELQQTLSQTILASEKLEFKVKALNLNRIKCVPVSRDSDPAAEPNLHNPIKASPRPVSDNTEDPEDMKVISIKPILRKKIRNKNLPMNELHVETEKKDKIVDISNTCDEIIEAKRDVQKQKKIFYANKFDVNEIKSKSTKDRIEREFDVKLAPRELPDWGGVGMHFAIEIIGEEENVKNAFELMRNILRIESEETIFITREEVLAIMGSGGKRINNIQQKTGAKLDIYYHSLSSTSTSQKDHFIKSMWRK